MDLPENKKNITVYLHVSVVPPNKKSKIEKIISKQALDKTQAETLYSADLHMYRTSYDKKTTELLVLNTIYQNAIDCNLHININQNTPRTINQIDSQGMKREYQRGNSCALFNVTSEKHCQNELQITCNPDFQQLEQEEELKFVKSNTYDYFRKGTNYCK